MLGTGAGFRAPNAHKCFRINLLKVLGVLHEIGPRVNFLTPVNYLAQPQLAHLKDLAPLVVSIPWHTTASPCTSGTG